MAATRELAAPTRARYCPSFIRNAPGSQASFPIESNAGSQFKSSLGLTLATIANLVVSH